MSACRKGSTLKREGTLSNEQKAQLLRHISVSNRALLRKKSQSDVLQKDRHEVKLWLEEIFHITYVDNFNEFFNDDTHKLRILEEDLQGGVILCQLADILKPGSLKRYHADTMGFPIKQMENVHIFAEWCKKEYHISQAELFTAKEVADGKYKRLFKVLLKLKSHHNDAIKHDASHHKHEPHKLIKREPAYKQIPVHKHNSLPRDSAKKPLGDSFDALLAIPSPPSSQPRRAPPSATPKLSLSRAPSISNILRTMSGLPPGWNVSLSRASTPPSLDIPEANRTTIQKKPTVKRMPTITEIFNQVQAESAKFTPIYLSKDDWDTDPDYVAEPVKPIAPSIPPTPSAVEQSDSGSHQHDEYQPQSVKKETETSTAEYTITLNRKRGKCEKPNCKCDKYYSRLKKENPEEDGGPCLNCGHYPVKHEDLGTVEELDQSEHIEHWKIDYSQLHFDFKIGSGAFGEVWKGTLWGGNVAIKVAKEEIDSHALREFEHEVAILCSLRHPNILLFIGAAIQQPNRCIVTELLEKGSLFNVLRDTNYVLDYHRRLGFAIDACLGMIYLHQVKIMHCDLKCGNLLVDANWRVCVADFGLAITAKKSASSNGEQLGTIGYMAPEIALQTSEFTYAADVYSFAICLWEIFTGMEPYANEDYYSIIRQLQEKERLPLPPEEIWPKELADLVSKCWAEDPSDRPSFEEIIIILRQLEKIELPFDPWVAAHEYEAEERAAEEA